MRFGRKAAAVLTAAMLAALPTAGAAGQNGAPPPVARTPSVTGAAEPAPIRRVKRHHAPGDPIEGVNRALFSVHQLLDRVLFRPLAIAYKTVVPRLVRTGIRHVLSNLGEPIVFVNDVLQLKPKKAARTFARFVINSTAGVAGLIDFASDAKLPHHNNGFGNTLGRYGVGPGPYLFLPLLGPSDLRDLLGGQADGLVLPLAIGRPFDRSEYIIPRTVLGGLDLRAESDKDLKVLLGGAADPYATLRSVYLQSRAAEVAESRGAVDPGALDDPLDDPETPGGTLPSAAPDAFDSTPADPEAPAATPPPATPDAFDSTPADPEAPSPTEHSAPPPPTAPIGSTPVYF